MTDKQFNSLLVRLSKANDRYRTLLDEAEEEFKKRYGFYPSEIDYDSWIDCFHIGVGLMTAEKIHEEMTGVYKEDKAKN